MQTSLAARNGESHTFQSLKLRCSRKPRQYSVRPRLEVRVAFLGNKWILSFVPIVWWRRLITTDLLMNMLVYAILDHISHDLAAPGNRDMQSAVGS